MNSKIINEICNIFKINSNSKIAVFIRHGEREEGLGSLLTSKGQIQSKIFGQQLKDIKVPIKIYTSPELRCIQTAEIINNLISNMNNEIIISNKLGIPGLQILNNEVFQQKYSYFNFNYRNLFSEWKKGLHYDALRDPVSLMNLSNEYLERTCTSEGITLYVSQSGTIAGIGYALKLVDYDIEKDEWVNNLDGFIIKR